VGSRVGVSVNTFWRNCSARATGTGTVSLYVGVISGLSAVRPLRRRVSSAEQPRRQLVSRILKKKSLPLVESTFDVVTIRLNYSLRIAQSSMASLASRSSQALRAASRRAPRAASKLVPKPTNAASYSLLARSVAAANVPCRTATLQVKFFFFVHPSV
jgi:hypothetical protein